MSRSAEQIKEIILPQARRVLGEGSVEVEKLGGDASNRIYHRCRVGNESLIVMELGGDPKRSEEASSAAQPAELPFVNVQRFLAHGGLSVPQIYHFFEAEGLLLLEDLGSETFESQVMKSSPGERTALYRQAIDELLLLQAYASKHTSGCECFNRCFDFELLRWELDHFKEWILDKQRGCVLSEREAQELRRSFDDMARRLSELPRVWVHRDFQSRNLMVQPGAEGFRLRVIDFQDALMGPPPYDLVALLRDSYVKLEVEQVQALLDYYLAQGEYPLEPEAFREMFWLQTVQRKLKDAGRFVFIDQVKHNPSFLKHIPNSLISVAEALEFLPQQEGLRSILAHHLKEFA